MFLRESVSKCAQQVSTMHAHGRRVRFRGFYVHQERAGIGAQQEMRAELPLTQDAGQHTQFFQDAGAIWPETYTRADFAKLTGPFKNFDGETRPEQGYPSGNAANAAADDGDGPM